MPLSKILVYMDKDDIYFIRWIVKQDGTEWQQRYGEEPVPYTPTAAQEPSHEPKEHPKFDYDKLIAESDGLYRQWWEMWKRIHPEWALHPEVPKVPIIKPAPKPKPTFKPLACKRCNSTWTPRSKELPVQCPRCHSPYWNKERKKR